MDRRKFLQGAAAAVAVSGWPGWLRRGFADVSVTPPMAGSKNVKDALAAGRALAKPVLVFVVPSDETKWERGHLFGEYLNNATDEQMAPLALAELVCATVGQLVGSGIAVADPNATLLVVEPGATTAKAVEVHPATWPDRERGGGVPMEGKAGTAEKPKTEEQIIDARILEMARAVKSALAADTKMVAMRAEAARKKYALLAAAYDGQWSSASLTFSFGSAELVAAVLLDKVSAPPASGSERHRLTVIAELARYAKSRWRKLPPSGSRWASSWGCGTDIEGEAPEAVGCGMGHVPVKSARFLYLFAKTPREEWQEEQKKGEK